MLTRLTKKNGPIDGINREIGTKYVTDTETRGVVEEVDRQDFEKNKI